METTPPHQPPRRYLRYRLVTLLLVIVVGGGALWLSVASQQSAGPATGQGTSGTLPVLPADKTVFRVATFNMHSGVGGDDNIYNINRTADAVRDPDVCALQECRGYLFGPVANQAQLLGQMTHHAWLFCPTERRYWHDEFGNALLTHLPVEGWVRIPLTSEPVHGGLRNVTIARVQFGPRTATVLFGHIDRSEDQTDQLLTVLRLFQSLKPPCLLLADLNAPANNAQVQALLKLPGVHDCIAEAHADAGTHDRIDWILSAGFKTIDGGRLQNGASDHPIYWADLKME